MLYLLLFSGLVVLLSLFCKSDLHDELTSLHFLIIQLSKGSFLVILIMELNKTETFAASITFNDNVGILNVKALEQSR